MGVHRRIGHLATVVAAAALLLGACSKSEPAQQPPDPPDPPVAVIHQYQAQELTVRMKPQADGTVRVTQRIVVDAGSGVSGGLGLTTKPIPLTDWIDDTRAFVQPELSNLTAIDITQPEQQVTLTVTADTDKARGLAYHKISPPHSWSPGRHLIEATMTMSGTWTEIDGRRTLVLPTSFLRALWYPPGDTTSVLSVSVEGVDQIGCVFLRSEDSPGPCPQQENGTVRFSGSLGAWASTPGPRVYLTAGAPSVITAAPSAPTKESRK